MVAGLRPERQSAWNLALPVTDRACVKLIVSFVGHLYEYKAEMAWARAPFSLTPRGPDDFVDRRSVTCLRRAADRASSGRQICWPKIDLVAPCNPSGSLACSFGSHNARAHR